jgi:hypothetical protein
MCWRSPQDPCIKLLGSLQNNSKVSSRLAACRYSVVGAVQAHYRLATPLILQVRRRFGVEVHTLKETPDGDISISHLESLLEDGRDKGPEGSGVTVVSISHIPTSSGRVYDAGAVGATVAKYAGIFHAAPHNPGTIKTRCFR